MRKRKGRFSRPDVQEIRRRHAIGVEAKEKYMTLTTEKIGEKFDVERSTILSIEKHGFNPTKHRHKLTLDDVYLILDLCEIAREYEKTWRANSTVTLAKEYNTGVGVISLMTSRRTYKEIEDAEQNQNPSDPS